MKLRIRTNGNTVEITEERSDGDASFYVFGPFATGAEQRAFMLRRLDEAPAEAFEDAAAYRAKIATWRRADERERSCGAKKRNQHHRYVCDLPAGHPPPHQGGEGLDRCSWEGRR